MTVLDLAVLAVLVLSVLFAYWRGVVRELVALAAWVSGLGAAVLYTDAVAARFAGWDVAPAARHVAAFALIVVVFLVAGALVAWLLRGAVHAVGLGFVDRFLGALFGIARGAIVAVVFALVAGLTALPRQDWWQNSLVGPVLAGSALALKPWLPDDWAARLDFSASGRARKPGTSAAARRSDGDTKPCAES
jgi:membrane protein required for colicin V production